MSMFSPDMWLDLHRTRLEEADRERRIRRAGAPRRPGRHGRVAGLATRLAAAVRVLLARRETVAEVHHLVLRAQRRRDFA